MTETFQGFIRGLVRKYGTAQAVADLIPMSVSAFSRGVRNAGTLEVDNLLRLALATGESPSKVLRLAGKAHVADLIEQLYGEPSPLTAADRELLDTWHSLHDESEHALRILLRALAASQANHAKRSA